MIKTGLKIGVSSGAISLACALSLQAAVYMVTNTADFGPGSLRQAMLDANANPGADEIDFAIGSGQATIQPKSSLPYLIESVVLAGSTQPGFADTPLIQIDGKLAGPNVDGLVFYTGSAGSAAKSMAMFNFDGAGVRLTNVSSVALTGCYLGTDASGAAEFVGNRRGVVVAHSSSAQVGGFGVNDGNVISGNREEGVLIEGADSANNRLDGNRIGTTASGNAALPNGGDGVRLVGNPQFNYLQANRIAFNGRAGVNVLSGQSIGIYQNSFRDNAGLGIDLSGDGVTPNDLGDVDSGPNTGQNYPDLTAAVTDGSAITVTGHLDSTADTAFSVELYWSEACDPSGHGEGQFLERFLASTDGSGRASFTRRVVSAVPAGAVVSAIAIHPSGHTSEFSSCQPVTLMRTNCLEVVCPSNLEFPCQQPEGTLVQYPFPRGTDQCTGEPLTWVCYPPYGLFPPGVTRVMCWGPLLESGEGAYCEFAVTVSTNCPQIPPCLIVHCPTNIVAPCESPRGSVVRYSFTGTNTCGGQVVSWCVPSSGSLFPPGNTSVSCTAIGSGQTNRCFFTVTVRGDCAPRLKLTRVANKLTLSWPEAATGYVPQQTTALGPVIPAWSNVVGSVVRVAEENQMEVVPANAAMFYQLFRPLTPRVPFPKPAHTTVDGLRALPHQVILKFHEGTQIRLRSGVFTFSPGSLSRRSRNLLQRVGLTEGQVAADVTAISSVLARYLGTVIERLASEIPESTLALQKSQGEALDGTELADMDLYYHLVRSAADAASASALINELNGLASIEIAYAQPMVGMPDRDIPPATSIVLNQNYLDPAPTGIDARAAWTFDGGRGEGRPGEPSQVIDVEGNWHLDHEDLRSPFFVSGILSDWCSIPFLCDEDRDEHGTAVLGLMVAPANDFGATGIVPEAQYGVSSFASSTFSPPRIGVPAAILHAGGALRRGDVILIEIHSLGPSSGQTCPLPAPCDRMGCGQFEFVPQEFFPADWDAIHTVTGNGIIVVEAAGNGSMNLDNPIYGGRFTRPSGGERNLDSGAILVGASNGGVTNDSDGDGTPDDDGTSNTACFSNFGTGVDVRGWGSGVATLGYGDVRPEGAGEDQRQWYTRGFNGTSSATPIVGGAILALQGILRARDLPPLEPAQMRRLIRAAGTPQAANAWNLTRPIGRMPDLCKMINAALPDAAAFVSQSVPPTMTPGMTYTVSITLQNVGVNAWTPGRIALIPDNPPNNTTWGLNRVELPAPVAPGSSSTFTYNVTAPSGGCTANFQWRLILDGIRFVGCATPNVVVNIGSGAAFTVIEPRRFAGDPVVIQDGNRRLHVFGRGLSGEVLHSPEIGPGLFQPLQQRTGSGFFQSNFAVARNRDNRLEIFGRRANDESYAHINQRSLTDSDWTGVEPVGNLTTFSDGPAAGVNFDGRLEVFGVNRNLDLSHIPQGGFPGGPFTIWLSLGGMAFDGPIGTPAVVLRPDGRLHVFARWTDNSVHHTAQIDPGGAWTGWQSLGGTITSDPVAEVNSANQIEVFVRGLDQTLYQRARNPDGNISPAWIALNSPRISSVSRGRAAVGRNFDGTLEVFVTGEDGAVYSSRQLSNMTWPSTWQSLGGSGIQSDPATGRNDLGELEVFVRGADSKLWHRKQCTPGAWR